MLLEIDNLDVSFRNDEGDVVNAAQDVNLTLDRGEILGIVGESGSGKSSVAMSAARLLPSPPAFYPKGRILFDGEDVLSMPVKRLRELRGRKIGVVFQDPMGSLSPLHRIGEQLVEGILLHEKISKKAAREMAVEWLGKVGIPDPETRSRAYPHELSGGMQKRVSFARAIVTEPQIILYDEPTAGLDPMSSTLIEDYIVRLKNETKAASIVVTHQMSTITRTADKVLMLYNGKVVFVGTPADLLRQETAYTKQFVTAALDGPMKMLAE